MANVPVMGVDVAALTTSELHGVIGRACLDGCRKLILNVNAHAMNLAWEDPTFRSAMQGADLVLCDGSGVRLAGWLGGYDIPERITYADWTWKFAEYSASQGLSWFLLGGAEGRAASAADALVRRVPSLRIVGAHHGFFHKAYGSVENRAVVETINDKAPDVLIVGFGMPIQELWLTENWEELTARVGLTGGAVFDYVSGAVRRSPWVLRRVGMEWLGRLLIEPRRLWRRYLVGNPKFILRALRYAAGHRLEKRGRPPPQ